MSWADKIIGFFTGETPEQIEAGFMETRKEFFDEYTPAERKQMDYEDNLNYVEHISGHPMRNVWQSEDDNYQFFEEYVIDQQGNKWVLDSGSRYTGHGEMERLRKIEIVQGEIVDEYPVYVELDGGEWWQK